MCRVITKTRFSARPLRFAWACLVPAVGLVLVLVVPGLKWGLPSEERNRLALGENRDLWHAPEQGPDEAADPWSFYPNYLRGGRERTGRLPRSAFNPIRSYHPDEYVILKSLSGMRPARLELFHGFFGWPAFHFYVVGATLKGAAFFGAAQLVPETDYYFRNPVQMARLYRIGRVVTLLFAIGCVVALWRCAGNLFGWEGGAAAALLLAVTPLFAINAHYLTADVAMLFWICLTLFASTRILRGGGRRWYVWAGVFLGLAAGTRYQGGLAAFLIAFAHLLREPKEDAEVRNIRVGWKTTLRDLGSKKLWLAAGVSVLIFLAVNPYVVLKPGQFCSEFLGELRGSRNPSSGLVSAALFVESGLGILLAVATLGALWMALARRDRGAVFVVLGFGVPAVLLWAGRPVMVRYMMPVLPLPVLLVAWAFAVVQRRGVTLGKLHKRLAAPILFSVVFLFTAHQSLAYCALFAAPGSDTRTRAGEWITRNVPPGATVGVASEPWQFELPPLDKTRLNVMIVAQDMAQLSQRAPAYFVSSDLQFPPVAVRGPLTPGEKAFKREVFEGRGRYRVVARFEAWPPGRRKLLSRGPHDMRYVNPVIVVAKLSPEQGRNSSGAGRQGLQNARR